MKNKLIRGGLVLALALIGAGLAAAQSNLSSSLVYTWTANSATTTGQLGNYIILNGLVAPRPAIYTIDFTVSGTAPSACTFHAQGSSDDSNWYNVDGGSAISCTASGAEFISAAPVIYLRINLITYTAGDSTTVVTFHYVGAPSNGNATAGNLAGGALGSVPYQTALNLTGLLASPTTNGHTFFLSWKPLGSAIAPVATDGATYLASPPAIGGTAPAAGGFTKVNVSSAQSVVNCSTSGTVTYSQPEQGSSFKEVIAYAAACTGTAAYTFPTAFTVTPDVEGGSAAIESALSTSAVTLTGVATTGW
ncbi:MAG: hypothetical protein ABSG60_15960 [Terracidiphilus sp.]